MEPHAPKASPAPMLTPYSSEDLGRIFDARTLTKGRTLILLSTVEVTLQDPSIAVAVEHLERRHVGRITPQAQRQHVMFRTDCSCGQYACPHLAAGALAALERYPALRRSTQPDLLETLAAPASKASRPAIEQDTQDTGDSRPKSGDEPQRLVFELSAGEPPHACHVAPLLVGERSGRVAPTTPANIIADRASPESARILARLLGGKDIERADVASSSVASVLGLLARIGRARWQATGVTLALGADRLFEANAAPDLPPHSAVIIGDTGPWYVDGAQGLVGRVKIKSSAPQAAPPRPGGQAAAATTNAAQKAVLQRAMLERAVQRSGLAAPARPPSAAPQAAPARAPGKAAPAARPPFAMASRTASPVGRPTASPLKSPGLSLAERRAKPPARMVRGPGPQTAWTSDSARKIPEAVKRAPTMEPVILSAPLTPVLGLRSVEAPDETGRPAMLDALTVDFDYEGVLVPADDERQFVRVQRAGDGPGHQSFVRRDREAETTALALLRDEGFQQMRVGDGPNAKGRVALIHRGRDAGERWQAFMAERVPALLALGWRNTIERDFGPRPVSLVGAYDLRVTDAVAGHFALDFGIEIDGTRMPLVPILARLLERGGYAAAKVIDGELITSLDDGRVIKLPAERIRRLLAVMADLIEAARRTIGGALVLEETEAASVLDLEDLLPTRWENAAAIEAYAAKFRGEAEIEPVQVPAAFTATLRPYQQQGVDWLQHLRAHGMGGFLADDMGLGKTAQTIAHIVVEKAEGRLDRPALIVVPTSLVANWGAELRKFAPGLRVAVLHGSDRHARRAELAGTDVVITTYTVLARDIEEMKEHAWHLVVLDEAQVIKSPDAKATKAVCQLDTRHRLALSGTPIENNLQELWSEFAFLMPGLLGDRRGFAKRFRTPIEKNNDAVRRVQLIRRIKPFLLRRTKAEVAPELPPKHTILRRVDLGAEQRELYDTIRGTLLDTVREKLTDLTASQGRIVVLDALLKLRQVCCDPRLVKLPAARQVEGSSKLDDLMEMIGEMLPEGRRILLFSQFTSMLDLIKPRLDEAGIRYVELRGDTRDRAEPVRAFEAGEVPLFLISLKAGGRGLNLISADTVIHYDPVVEPGGRGSGVGSRAPNRPNQVGVCLQADRRRHGRGPDRRLAAAQGEPGQHRAQRRGRVFRHRDGGHRLPVRHRRAARVTRRVIGVS